MTDDRSMAAEIATKVLTSRVDVTWAVTDLVAGSVVLKGDDPRVTSADHLGWLPVPDLLHEPALPEHVAYGRRLLQAWEDVADHVLAAGVVPIEPPADAHEAVRRLVECTIDWAEWPEGFWRVAFGLLPEHLDSLQESLEGAPDYVKALLATVTDRVRHSS